MVLSCSHFPFCLWFLNFLCAYLDEISHYIWQCQIFLDVLGYWLYFSSLCEYPYKHMSVPWWGFNLKATPPALVMFLVWSSTAQAAKSSSRLPAAIHVTSLTEKPGRVIQSSRWKYQAQTGLLASWEPKCLESLESKIVFFFLFHTSQAGTENKMDWSNFQK